MAASATGATASAALASTSKPTEIAKPETDSLPSLFARLGDDVMQLFDTKLSLLKVEIKEEANEYARDGIMIGGGCNHRRHRLCVAQCRPGFWNIDALCKYGSEPAGEVCDWICDRGRSLSRRRRHNHHRHEKPAGEAKSRSGPDGGGA